MILPKMLILKEKKRGIIEEEEERWKRKKSKKKKKTMRSEVYMNQAKQKPSKPKPIQTHKKEKSIKI